MKNMGHINELHTCPSLWKEILQIFVVVFLMALDVDGLNILDSIISRVMKYYGQHMELLVSFRSY